MFSRLTLDEARATATQTLEVVYDLVRHRKHGSMENGSVLHHSQPRMTAAYLTFPSSATNR